MRFFRVFYFNKVISPLRDARDCCKCIYTILIRLSRDLCCFGSAQYKILENKFTKPQNDKTASRKSTKLRSNFMENQENLENLEFMFETMISTFNGSSGLARKFKENVLSSKFGLN